MFCHKCGANIDDGSMFCPYCGTQTGTPANNVQPQQQYYQNNQQYSQNYQNPQQYNYNQNYQNPQQQYYQNPQQYNQAPAQQGNTIAIVGFILSFFVAIAGLICSIMGYKAAKNNGAPYGGLALAGIIISSVSMGLAFLLYFSMYMSISGLY